MALVRTDSPMNELADAIVAKLQGISERRDARYLSTPTKVVRGLSLGDFAQAPKPLLAVCVESWEATPRGAQQFDGHLKLGVHCMTDATAEAEAALLRLVSDVVLALVADVTVGGRAVYLFPESFEPNVDAMKATGLAVTTVRFDCLYNFNESTP